MIESELFETDGILIIQPHGALESADFVRIARQVEPYLQKHGKLRGLMIETETFPGWSDFAALVSHFQFVAGHHSKIDRVAAVTDSAFLTILPAMVDHFIGAEVKHFDYVERDAALAWLKAE